MSETFGVLIFNPFCNCCPLTKAPNFKHPPTRRSGWSKPAAKCGSATPVTVGKGDRGENRAREGPALWQRKTEIERKYVVNWVADCVDNCRLHSDPALCVCAHVLNWT